MSAEPPTWLVTGAHGFLGANIGSYLEGRARRIGVARTDGVSRVFDEMLAADLLDPGPLIKRIHVIKPDVIIHSAALAHHDRCEADPDVALAVNAVASHQLARAAAEAGSAFVLISTDAVFDGVRGHYAESDPPNPTSVYGRTKVAAEELVLGATDAIVIRTNFFGWSPSGTRSILEFFVNSMSNGEQVRGFTDFMTSTAYAQTLSDAIWQLVSRQATGIFHVTSPDAMTKYDFGVATATVFDLDPTLITPARADIHPPRNGDISLDVSKFEEYFGSRLPTIHEGLQKARQDADQLRQRLAETHAP